MLDYILLTWLCLVIRRKIVRFGLMHYNLLRMIVFITIDVLDSQNQRRIGLNTLISNVFNEFKVNCIELNVLELGIITRDNYNITGQSWVDALSAFEKDLKYEKRCRGFLKSKINNKTDNVIITGRPEKYSKKQLSEALMLKDRYTIREIAQITGISKNTLLRASKKMQL